MRGCLKLKRLATMESLRSNHIGLLKTLLPLLAFLSASCEPGDRTPSSREPALPEVLSSIPAWGPGAAWTIEPRPTVVIGETGIVRTELFRVYSAVVLSTGGIAVGNSGTQELLLFDQSGNLVRRVGGTGEGPGEFRRINFLRRWMTDSVAVYDAALRRVTIFSATGDYSRTITIRPSPTPGPFSVRGFFDDGTFLITSPTRKSLEPALGSFRGIDQLFRVSADGLRIIDSLGTALSSEAVFLDAGDGVTVGVPARFGRSSWYATHRTTLYVATNETFRIRAIDVFTGMERSIVKVHPQVPITSDVVESVKAREEQNLKARFGESEWPAQRRVLNANSFPATFPSFGARRPRSALHVSASGDIWIHEYPIPNQPALFWSVFDQTGMWLGKIEVPDSLDVLDVGDDYLLGKRTDDLGLESIGRYTIRRPAPLVPSKPAR